MSTKNRFPITYYIYLLFIVFLFVVFFSYVYYKYQIVFLIICILLIPSFILSILFHELGHFIIGKVFGYDCTYFRFLNLIFIKKEKVFLKILYFDYKTIGQCMLYPRSEKSSKFGIIASLSGGYTFNFILSLFSFIGLLLFKSEFFIFIIYPFCFANLIMAIKNFIPLKVLNTDGYNIMKVIFEKSYYENILYQLLLFNDMSYGCTYFAVSDKSELLKISHMNDDNILLGNIIKYYSFIERDMLIDAKLLIEELLKKTNGSFFEILIKAEFITYMFTFNSSQTDANSLRAFLNVYGNNISKHIFYRLKLIQSIVEKTNCSILMAKYYKAIKKIFYECERNIEIKFAQAIEMKMLKKLYKGGFNYGKHFRIK